MIQLTDSYDLTEINVISGGVDTNTVDSEELHIIDSVSGKVKTIPLKLSQLNTYWKRLLRMYYIASIGGYVDSKNTLRHRSSTATVKAIAIRRFATYIADYSTDIPLTQWTMKKVDDLLCKSLKKELDVMDWNERDRLVQSRSNHLDAPILSMGSISMIFSILERSKLFYDKGLLPSGIMIDLPKKTIKNAISGDLDRLGISYGSYLRGGSNDSIPTHIAMIMLSDAISTLRGYKYEIVSTFFEFSRSNKATIPKKRFNIFPLNNDITDPKFHFRNELYNKLNKITTPEDIDISTLTATGFSELCDEVREASLVIFLCLTGVRKSEFLSIKAGDHKKNKRGDWVFDSDIDKTQYGIAETRVMSGLVAEACDALINMSYHDKIKHKLPLFCHSDGQMYTFEIPQGDHEYHGWTSSGLNKRLSAIYNKTVAKHGESLRAECPKISPHMFRHSFAEFAIRRFDGNVLEALRQHYRHAAGSYFTMRYAGQKLRPEVEEQIEKDYLYEMIKRYTEAGFDDTFVGKTALKIKKLVGNNVEVVSPKEMHHLIANATDLVASFTPHDYGFCVLWYDQMHLAKCINPKTGLPEIKGGHFTICPGCPNNLIEKVSHKESIIHKVLSHQSFLDRYPIKTGQVYENSKQAVKNGQKTLKEMEAV